MIIEKNNPANRLEILIERLAKHGEVCPEDLKLKSIECNSPGPVEKCIKCWNQSTDKKIRD